MKNFLRSVKAEKLLWIVMLQIMFFFVFGVKCLEVNAFELTPSSNTISIPLAHEHREETCYERRWIPCGGIWKKYWEYSVEADVYSCSNAYSQEVVNGVVLNDIHVGWHCDEKNGTHAGEYSTIRTCGMENAGHFLISRIENGEEIYLETEVQGESISEYEIWWNGVMADNDDGNNGLSLSRNGVHEIKLRWFDEQAEEWKENVMEYEEYSLPITVLFQSEGELLLETTLMYGGELPSVEIPVKTGYVFQGFYLGEEMCYDKDGNAIQNFSTCFEETLQIIEARWEAKCYNIYYGTDEDLDGVPDEILEVTYGENYESILPPENIGNKIFDGYYLGEEKVFDAEGNPTGTWHWDIGGNIVLEARFVTPQAPAGEPQSGENENQGSDDEVVEISTEEEETEEIIEDIPTISQEPAVSINQLSTVEEEGGYSSENVAVDKKIKRDLINENDEREVVPDTMESQMLGVGENIEEERGEAVQETEVEVSLPRYGDAPETQTPRMLDKQMTTKGVVATVTVSLVGMGLLLASYYFFLFATAKIYVVQEESRKKELGRVMLRKKGNGFRLLISPRLVDHSENGWFGVEFSDAFLSKNRYKDLLIDLPEGKLEETIKEKVLFRII